MNSKKGNRLSWRKILTFCLTLCFTLQLFALPSSAATYVGEDGKEFVYYLNNSQKIPEGFVNVLDYVPDAIIDLRYFGTDNFVGAQIDGYEANVVIMTKEAAQALKKAADSLREKGYILKIWDTYRPTDALRYFSRWTQNSDISNKACYYPNLTKSQITERGYLAPLCCVHSRGSSIDLTLVDIETGEELDMGTDFDFFDTKSHHGTSLITEAQAVNRRILRDAMVNAGFESLPQEWWHYKLYNEPYPETYFNFPVKDYFSEI